MPTSSTARFRIPITNRNEPETSVPISPVVCCSVEDSSVDGAAERAHAGGEQHREHEHDRRVAEREEEADAERPPPSAISLRVVLSIAAMWSASNAWRSPSV